MALNRLKWYLRNCKKKKRQRCKGRKISPTEKGAHLNLPASICIFWSVKLMFDYVIIRIYSRVYSIIVSNWMLVRIPCSTVFWSQIKFVWNKEYILFFFLFFSSIRFMKWEQNAICFAQKRVSPFHKQVCTRMHILAIFMEKDFWPLDL